MFPLPPRIRKTPSAHLTNERSLPRVPPLVHNQRRLLTEPFSAKTALVRLHVQMLHLDVRLQVLRLPETFLAHLALVRPLSGVNVPVNAQTQRVSEYFVADVALQRPFNSPLGHSSAPSAHVLLEQTELLEAVAARLANVRGYAGVLRQVGHQLDLLDEALPADVADVRTFAAVDHLVSPQVVDVREGGGAMLAEEGFLFGVAAHVAGEARSAGETLVAERAGELAGQGVFEFLEVVAVFRARREGDVAEVAVES